jgi:NAD(P)H-flavin reductase
MRFKAYPLPRGEGGVLVSEERYVNAVIEDVERIDKYLIVKLRPLEEFKYSPGNSIDIYLDPSYCGGEKCFRVFSLASSPTEDKLMIATIHRGSRFKNALEKLEGGVVRITGPWSKRFSLRENVEGLLFIPYGIGVSPIRSMLKYIYDRCLTIPAKLIHVDVEGFFLFREEIEGFARRKPNIAATFTTTIPKPEEIKAEIARLGNPFIYVSGPPRGTKLVVNTIKAAGVNLKGMLAVEVFSGYEEEEEEIA